MRAQIQSRTFPDLVVGLVFLLGIIVVSLVAFFS
jgi:hypothetical protein